MKAKKLLAMIMAAALAVSAFAGCSAPAESSSSETSNKSESSASSEESKEEVNTNVDGDLQLNEPGALPLVVGDEPGEVSIFTAVHVDTHSKFESEYNTATKWYEEKTNTKISWTTVSQADKIAKLNLLFQSSDYEDIIFFTFWDGATQYAYGSQGYLIPLNEYLDGDDAYYWNIFKEKAIECGEFTQNQLDNYIMPDGNIYSMGQISGALHSRYASRMWIYQPWLDTLKLDTPTTTEEYYDVLKAFKEKDPNGNGKADEVPLTGAITGGWNLDPTEYLMNSFVYYTKQGYYFLDDEKVTMSYTTDGYKQGLEYMAKLMDEGLLSKDIYTNDVNAVKNLTTQDTQYVGSVPGGAWGSFTTAVANEPGDWTNWVPLAPLEGPEGVQYAKYFDTTPAVKAHITNNCEYPKLAFRMLDFMYEEECGMNLKTGVDGAWEYAEEGDIAINGEQAKWSIIKAQGQTSETNFGWSQIGVASEPPGWHSFQKTNSDDPVLDIEGGLYRAGVLYEEYAPEEEILVPQLIFNEEDSVSVIDYATQINEYITSQTSTMLTTNTVGENWDTFQEQLKALGVEELTALYQKGFDERKARIGG